MSLCCSHFYRPSAVAAVSTKVEAGNSDNKNGSSLSDVELKHLEAIEV